MKLGTFVFLQVACVVRVHVSGFSETKGIQNNGCLEPLIPGPCRAAKPRWYFDMDSHECREFTYGGCGGNNNNFATHTECQYACSTASRDQGICSLDPQKKICDARAQFWYFDPVENTCHRFPPGFCGSSANRFATCQKCMRRCSRADADKECSLAYKKLHFAKQGIYWPGNTEPRVRGPNVILPGHSSPLTPPISGPGEIGTLQGATGVSTRIIKTPTLMKTGQGVQGHAGTGVPPLIPPTLTPSSVQRGQAGEGVSGSTSGRHVLAGPLPGAPATLLGNRMRQPIINSPGTMGTGQAGSFLRGPQILSAFPQTSSMKPGGGGNDLYSTGKGTNVASQLQPGLELPGPNMVVPVPTGTNPSAPISLSTPSLTVNSPPLPALPEPGLPVGPSAGVARNQGGFPQRASDLKTPPLTIPENLLKGFRRTF